MISTPCRSATSTASSFPAITDWTRSGGTLLLVKDSFANCLVPFLARDYRRILLVDERYAAVSLMELAQSEQVDEIAVVKEACSF